MTDTITLPRSVVEQAQVEQEPFTVLVRKYSWLAHQWEAAPRGFPDYGKSWADERINVYIHPQNLRCKSNQARLATLWGYVKPQPQGEQEPVGTLSIEVTGPRTRIDVEWNDPLYQLPVGNYKLYTHPQPPRQPQVELDRIEQYRLQMAAIMTAALGYWKEGDSIHPDYDTVALRDVAKLYAKYDELFNIVHGIGGEK